MIDFGNTRPLGGDGSDAWEIVGWSLDNDVDALSEASVVDVVVVEVEVDVVVLGSSTTTVPVIPCTMRQ